MGKRVKKARIAAGMTLAQLHDRAGLEAAEGLAKNRMVEIENGGVGSTRKNKQGIRFGTLYALAMALDLPPSALMPSAAEVAEKAGVSFIEDKTTRLGSR